MEITAQAVCDLRMYNSAKAMEKISKIKDVALLLVPKDMDDETRAAYAAIEKKNVASEIEVDNDYSPLIFNGDTEITDASLPNGESVVIVNGNARIFRLSPGKTAKVTVNGNLLYDIRSKSQIQIIGANGDIKAANFDKLVELPRIAVLTPNLLCEDPETLYQGSRLVLIPSLHVQAQGTVSGRRIIADRSVQNSALKLNARQIHYRDGVSPDVCIKQDLDKLRISAGFLEQINGQLICTDIRHVIIEKSVTPELLREKVLLMSNIHHIKATKKTFDAAQLLAEDVEIISK